MAPIKTTTSSLRHRLSSELGFTTLAHSSRDVYLLLGTRFIRMFAYGSSTLILALYFRALGHSDSQIGLFMSLTLVGDVIISLALTFVADSLGRRNILILGALLMTASGSVFALFDNFWILLAAAVVGVISPSGNEIGPFRAVEESTLAQLSDPATRSDIFAWYVIFGTLGTAGGTLVCGWGTQALQKAGMAEVASYRVVFAVYAVIGLVKAGLDMLLSKKCEAERAEVAGRAENPGREAAAVGEHGNGDDNEEEQPFLPASGPSAPPPTATPPPAKKKSALAQISPASRRTLAKLCGLFFFDSLGSGMITSALMAFFFATKFGMPEGQLGSIISSAQFMASFGNMFASSLAKRIGLVRTMVFTHLPSALFLALIPAPSSLAWSVVLLVLRSSLSSMDQAPRSAFLAAVVLPHERTAVMGVVNTVKTMSQSSGPFITGLLAEAGYFWVAYLIAGMLKVGYDLGMLYMFAGLKLEGEKGKQAGGSGDGQEEEGEGYEMVGGRREGSEDENEDENRDRDGAAHENK